jgi:hypothetical protein
MSDHTGFPAMRIQTLERAVADDIDNAQRLHNKALLDVLRRLLQDAAGAVQSGVLEGLRVSAAASGALAVDVDAGLAFYDDAGSLTDADLDSPYHAIQLRASSEDVSIAAAHSTLDRIDAVYVSWTGGTWESELRDVRPSAGAAFVATSIDKRIGPEITVSVVTGTADASPVAPSIPAGGVLLAHVTVAAGATTSAGLTVSDQRSFLPTPSVPGTLADGTTVDGDLTVTDDIEGGGNLTLTDAAGVVDVAGRVKATRLSTSGGGGAVDHITLNEDGDPDSDADVIVINRPVDGTPAKLAYDDSEEAWTVDPGRGVAPKVVTGLFTNSGAIRANTPMVAVAVDDFSFAGGSTNEPCVMTFSSLPGTTMVPLFAAAVVMQDASSIDADLFVHTVDTSTGAGSIAVTAILRRGAGGNVSAGTAWIRFFLVFSST